MSAYDPQFAVDWWNASVSVGAPVRYWIGITRKPRQSRTTGRALLVDDVPSVPVSGQAFPIALSHVDLVPEGGAS